MEIPAWIKREEISVSEVLHENQVIEANLTSCHCGKFFLLDKVLPFECGSTCEKPLGCGTEESPHKCGSLCHTSDCPPCNQTELKLCRCGRDSKLSPCADNAPFCCEKLCRKGKKCTRCRCFHKCCIDKDHECQLRCGTWLECREHRCRQFCHRGACGECPKCPKVELSVIDKG